MHKLTKKQEQLLDKIALSETIEEFRTAFFKALEEVEPTKRELIIKHIIDKVNEELKKEKERN